MEEMDLTIQISDGENNGDSNQNSSGRSIALLASVDAPEKKLALFALRLAIIEITASGLGQLAFIWANVILLGGFTSNLKPKDFWFVTAILAVEGTRLFTGSYESRTLPANNSRRQTQSHLFIPLRLVGAAMRALSASQPSHRLAYKMQTKGICLPADVTLRSYSGWVFVSMNNSLLLYWLQIFAVATCVALSLMQLGQQDYGDDAQINEKSALNVFYGLALAEGLMFLLGEGYWAWKIEHGKLIERVSKDYEGLIDMDSLCHFFYYAYSRCIDGIIFDGLKMDLFSFAEDLLQSDSPDKQIIGARILKQLDENPRFAAETLRKIGSSTPVIERLIEILNSKDTAEPDLRLSASKIVSKIVLEEQQELLVAAISGAIESIASLLDTGGDSADGRTYEASPTAVIVDKEEFKLLGLLILESLAKYHDNCQKIGNAPGLLAKIIDLTSASEALLTDEPVPELQIKTVHHTLQVVKILATATRETGEILRRDVSEIAFLVSNIETILKYGQSHLKLQMLGLQILTSLAMNENTREAKGSMLRIIVEVFFRPIVPEEVEVGAICNEAGEALAMLLESLGNCKRMLEINKVVSRLVDALDFPALRVNAMRILRCLCSYSNPERSDRLQIVGTMPMVLRTIMEEQEKEKFLEASLGIATKILKFWNAEDLSKQTPMAGIIGEDFVKKMVEILRRYENPKCEVSRMRIFVIELANDLMKYDRLYIELFRCFGMKQVLMRTAETASNFECLSIQVPTLSPIGSRQISPFG